MSLLSTDLYSRSSNSYRFFCLTYIHALGQLFLKVTFAHIIEVDSADLKSSGKKKICDSGSMDMKNLNLKKMSK